MSNITRIRKIFKVQRKADQFFEVRGKEKEIEAKHNEPCTECSPESNWRKKVISKEQKALALQNQVNRELTSIQMRRYT
jgi:hypothetical protein